MNIDGYRPKNFVPDTEVLNELKNHMLVDGFDFILDLNESQFPYFTDSRTKKNYMDFFTCFASLPIGMNHPKLIDDDFVTYLGKMAVNKPSNSDIYTSAQATFVKTVHQIALPDYFKYSFYICGGALAVENALKTAFDWKVRKNFLKGYKEEKGHQIMHFRQCFHGRSGYTMSLTNTDPNKILYYPKFEWPRISNPKLKFPLTDDSLAQTIKAEDIAIEEIKTAFLQNKDDIAAIIIEPIQGEGGDNHFRSEFLQAIRRLADENEALLIFDEVQTGVGITGKWWAHQHFGVIPDIMVFGKKMQVCGIAVTNRIDDIPNNVFHTSSRINSTWGGNLVDMVRATKYLEIIEDENLVENCASVGKVLLSKLNLISQDNPDLVSNVRGKGLFCAFDIINADKRKSLVDECFKNELLILPCGERTVRFRPPLNLTESMLNEGLEIISNAINTL
jgi:L-lysine 6-transaminase